MAVLPSGFGKKFNLPVDHGSETQTKRKERGIVVASSSRSIISYQVEAILTPRELENNAYAKFWRDNKEYYGIFEKGL